MSSLGCKSGQPRLTLSSLPTRVLLTARDESTGICSLSTELLKGEAVCIDVRVSMTVGTEPAHFYCCFFAVPGAARPALYLSSPVASSMWRLRRKGAVRKRNSTEGMVR